MANGWTLAELKKIAKQTGATLVGQRLVQPVVGKPRRKRKVEETDADRQIKAANRMKLHRQFETAWHQLSGPPLNAELLVIAGRKYRSDYIHERAKVSIEINGGTWSKKKTAHNSGVGLERDATKQNLVVMSGYTPFVLTSKMLSKKSIVENLLPIIKFIEERLSR